MKKFLTLLFTLILPTQALAWESSVGVSYNYRTYHIDDQLGAISFISHLNPTMYNGANISGDFLIPVKSEAIGPEVTLGWGKLNVPYQSGYYTKTAGEIVTDKLRVLVSTVSAKVQIMKWGNLQTYVKPGVVVNTLFSGTNKIDIDTASMLSFEGNFEISDSLKLSVDVQGYMSPSIRGAHDFVPSFGVMIGLRRVFKSKPLVQEKVIERVIVKPVDPPAPPTPVVLPSPPTPAVELPKEVTPQISEITKVKATLKFESDGRLAPESETFMGKLLGDYAKVPSTIKIQHKTDETSTKKAESIRVWLLTHGVPEKDVIVEPAVIEKTLKINVIPK